jgi:hypothetical protein
LRLRKVTLQFVAWVLLCHGLDWLWRRGSSDPFDQQFFWVPFIIALALSAAQFVINRLLQPRIQRGKLTGDLFIQNSEEGAAIHQVYGGAPGSVSVIPTWTNLTNVVVQDDNSLLKTAGDDDCFENAEGTGDAGARTIQSVSGGDWEVQWSFRSDTEGRGYGGMTTNAAYTNDFEELQFCIHVSDQNNTSGTPHPPHSVFVYENGFPNKAFIDGVYEPGDPLTIRCVDNVVTYWHKETLIYTSLATPTYPMYFGASLACLNKTLDDLVMVRAAEDGRGGMKLAGNIIWAKKPRKVSTKKGGKGGPKVEEITYYTDLAIMGGEGPWTPKKLWANSKLLLDFEAKPGDPTGIALPTGADGTYSITGPPDPDSVRAGLFTIAIRYMILNGVFGNPLLAGASLRIYEGNYQQLADPLIQADVDAAQGADSTPAFRGRFYIVWENFNISKFGGSVPMFFMLVEHKELKTLGPILDHLCDEVGIEPGDRDFSDFDGVQVRGIETSSLRSPRGVMEVLGLVYNLEFFESVDGVLTGVNLGGASEVTIAPEHLGAVEGDSSFSDNDVPQLLDTNLLDEVQLPRTINVTAFDPDKEYEKTNQPAFRMQGFAAGEHTIDLPMTLLVDEIRQTAERSIYRQHVEAESAQMSLPPVYGYLDAATVVTVSEGGVTHRLRTQSINGALPGALAFDLVADQAEVFDQSATVGESGGGRPPQKVAVTVPSIVLLMDIVNLRDEDNSPGYYAAVVPLDEGDWAGAGLYEDRGADYELKADFTLPAVAGKAANTLSADDGTSWDYTNHLDVDLYADGALESKTEAQVLNGANAAVYGNEIIQFQTATKLGGFPNRWRLTNLLRGRRGSEYATTHSAGERFVLLDGAVKFLPKALSDRGVETNWKAVTFGYSLADTNSTTFTWDCQNLKPLSVVQVEGERDMSNNLTITWIRRSRIGHETPYQTGQDPPLGEQEEKYEVDILDGVAVVRTITVTSPTASYSAAEQTTDGLTPGDPVTVKIYQISATVGRGQVREATV